MSLTIGVQGPSATPATDFYAILATKLAALGWLQLTQIPLATAGTTGNVEVWHSAATIIAGTIYTGCILYIEVNDAGPWLRIRVSEVYDSSVAGSPADRVKWAAAGITTSATSTTPAASYAMADTFGPLFVTPATTAKVGYVTIPTSVSGFAYWVGGGASRFLVCNNSGGNPHFCIAGGPIETLLGSGDNTSVYLIGGQSTAGGTDTSWTLSTAENANVRTSREPLIIASTAGAFCFMLGRALPDESTLGNTAYAMGSLGGLHKYHTTLVVSPAVLHGVNGLVRSFGRSHRGIVTGVVVTGGPENGAMAGDTLTAGGVVYTIIGATISGNAAAVTHVYGVDSSAF